MTLTFDDVSAAFDKAMSGKDPSGLKEILATDFRWRMLSRKDGASATKEQTIYWNLKTDMVQSNYKTIYNGNGIVVGTFNLSESGEEDSVVLCLGHLNRAGTQVILCDHLSGPYTEGRELMSKLGFLL